MIHPNNTVSNLYFQGPHHSPVFISRSIFLQLEKNWDAGRKWAKYTDQCVESKIKIQTQYLLEHTDLCEAAVNEEMAQVAQTCGARKAPGEGVQELGSSRTISVVNQPSHLERETKKSLIFFQNLK